MKASEILDKINDIEMNYPVNDWIINDIQIWPIIRIQIKNVIFNHHYIKFYKTSRKSIFSKYIGFIIKTIRSLFRFIRAYLKDISKNIKPDKKADVIFLSYTIDRVKLKNQFYNKLCDPLIEILSKSEFSSFVMEQSGTRKYLIPRYNPSMFVELYFDLIKLKSLLEFIVKKNYYNKIQLDGYSELIQFLETRYEATLPNVFMTAIYLRNLTSYFKKIFAKVRPLIGITTQFTSEEGMAFTKACRELGIISMDLPHGSGKTNNSTNAAYERWSNVPEKGYDLLPSWFLCWQEERANAINKWNYCVNNEHNTLTIGNLFLYKKWLDDQDEIVKYYDDMIDILKKPASKSTHILYANAYNIPHDFLFDVIKNKSLNCWWWIRLHPCATNLKEEFKDILEKKQIKNFYIEEATSLPLYALLRKMDILVTEHSSTVVEAEELGVPSIIIHKWGEEIHPEQIQKGITVTAYNSQELENGIYLQKNKKLSGIKEDKELFKKQKIAMNQLIDIIRRSKNSQKPLS